MNGQKLFSDEKKMGRNARLISRMRLAGYLFVLLTGICVFILVSSSVDAPDIRFNSEDVVSLEDGWTVTVGGRTEAVRLPVHIGDAAKQTVTFSTVLNGDSSVRNSIMVRGQHQYIKIFLDGTLLKEFGYNQTTILGNAPYSGWILARLPDGWMGKTLTIEQTAYYDNYAGLLGGVYLGTKNALVFLVLQKCLPSFIFNLAILIIGILLLIISLFFHTKSMVQRIRYLSIFALITSLWMVMESGGYQFVIGKAPIVSCLVFILFGMVPAVCLRFLLTYETFSQNRYLNGVYYLSIAVYLLQQILQLTGICDYLQSIAGTHFVIILAICGVFGQFFSSIIHKRALTDQPVYVSCLVFSALGCIDIIRFYFGNPAKNPVFFCQAGLFLFFLILSYYAVQDIVVGHENIVKKQFFERMAFTDLLTGIPNRNAFERELERYRSSGGEEHPLILVADLNNLKKINDTLGHSKGDLAITEVAHALLHTFSGCASVFRIGGDEFCVISSTLSETAMEKKCEDFQNALKKVSARLQLPLTIALGWRKEQGEGADKAFNRADALMYEDKINKKNEELS